MTYLILVDVASHNDDDDDMDAWEGRWIPLTQREEGQYVAELQVNIEGGSTILALDEPSEGEIQLFTRFAYAERVLEAAQAWRAALLAINGVAAAENALMAALAEVRAINGVAAAERALMAALADERGADVP